jgi:hypothetical protein
MRRGLTVVDPGEASPVFDPSSHPSRCGHVDENHVLAERFRGVPVFRDVRDRGRMRGPTAHLHENEQVAVCVLQAAVLKIPALHGQGKPCR